MENAITYENAFGIGILMAKIEYWTRWYEFSFQFWGEDNNNVFINKDDVEVASFGGEDTVEKILTFAVGWCERVNPRYEYPKWIMATIVDPDDDN